MLLFSHAITLTGNPRKVAEPSGSTTSGYVPRWSGFAYTAFFSDVFSRRIVGWRTAATMTSALVADALDMAIFSRRHERLTGVVGKNPGFTMVV